MPKFSSSLNDIVKGVRAFKELVNELKSFYPEISTFFAKKGANPDEIRRAISFAVNKIMNDPYVILGVNRDDPPELIDAVYRVKAKFYHPDAETGNKEKFIRLQKAYEEIKSSNR